jgi:hypothetical protein
MARILKSVIVIFMSVLILGGALAYFGAAKADAAFIYDTGKPALKISDDGPRVGVFNVSNLVPGADGSKRVRLVNTGKQTGQLGVCFSSITNTPGNIGEYADGSGDLGANMEIALYIDVDGDNNWDGEDTGLRSDGITYLYPTALEYDVMQNYGGITWNTVGSMTPSTARDFVILWRIPVTVGNEIQGDSVSFDISFFIVS